jgi:hypothetical protein
MMSFYDRKGVESWSQGIVPHFITCNAFIGRAYAKVLLGFLHDCASSNACLPLTVSESLYIVELGAGSGKFSFFILKVLRTESCVTSSAGGQGACRAAEFPSRENCVRHD